MYFNMAGSSKTNLKYRSLYHRIAMASGIDEDKIDLAILYLVKYTKRELDMKGRATVPYFGRFEIRRVPPRKRWVMTSNVAGRIQGARKQFPAKDKLVFKINKHFSKLFR